MANDISKGHAVFTTNFSFFATTEVISLIGATPVFIDIDKRTFNTDPPLLESQIIKILNEGKLIPKAIIAVNLFGQLADYSAIQKIAKKYNLLLIEDAAQSFGASYKNKKSCSFGDVAATSFFPAKPLGCYGDGGAIFTNNSKQAELYKSLRVHGQGKDKYDNIRIGLNSRLDTLQAAVLLNKLKIFNKELILRENIAKFYSKNLSKYLTIPHVSELNQSSWAQYSLLANSIQERDRLINHLGTKGIPTAIYYKKIFSELNIYKNLNHRYFPNSKNSSDKIFSIPMYPYLSKVDLNKVISAIQGFFK